MLPPQPDLQGQQKRKTTQEFKNKPEEKNSNKQCNSDNIADQKKLNQQASNQTGNNHKLVLYENNVYSKFYHEQQKSQQQQQQKSRPTAYQPLYQQPPTSYHSHSKSPVKHQQLAQTQQEDKTKMPP